MFYPSHVKCQKSPVTCHLSPVTCYLLPITCHLPCLAYFLSYVETAFMLKPLEAMKPQRKETFEKKARSQHPDGHRDLWTQSA